MAKGGTLFVRKDVHSTSMRYHEVALQRWFYARFFVAEGYPVPMVFASPMDAHSEFLNLWKAPNNPFKYLLDAKDSNGTPIYQPYPANVMYPLISVYRTGWSYRPEQNFTIHRFRHVNWPTVSTDVDQCDLGNVTTSRMPAAWNYRWQINFHSMRPDTQAIMLEDLMQQFTHTGGSLQTWANVTYPGWGNQLVRLTLDSDEIQSATPEAPNDGDAVEYTTAFNLTLEGYSVDRTLRQYPALWSIIFGNPGPLDPETLNASCDLNYTTELRSTGTNPVMAGRTDVPAKGNCADALVDGYGTYAGIEVVAGNPDVPLVQSLATGPNDPNNPNAPSSTLNPDNWQSNPALPYYSGGIASSEVFGTPTVTIA